MFRPNRYKSHQCGDLRASHSGETVTLSGWVHYKRNFGGLYFLVLRDQSGIVQIVVGTDSPFHSMAEEIRVESVVQIVGEVKAREDGNVNPNMATGEVEVHATSFEIHSAAEILPFQIADEIDASETVRLEHRFLDLRRDRLQKNMLIRSQVIQSIRRRMTDMDFHEFQTPILTSSSPEGARDFLVPSRLHPGKCYALPQAPQQFKQLLMVSGFSRYFQIAPCFRDEDARADRSPGEFYQLDIEMAFVEQEDVFAVLEKLLIGLFKEFTDWEIADEPFPRITYRDAMLRYGSDKPDLRFGCIIQDVSELFAKSEFRAFQAAVEEGGVVRAIPVPGAASQSRRFFDSMDALVKEQGGKGCAWLSFPEGGEVKGSLKKALSPELIESLKALDEVGDGSAILLIAGKESEAATLAGRVRTKVADELDLREKKVYRFCWIIDFPMFEWDEDKECVEFSHNPFSMPQGGMEALETQDPLSILAHQYDIVCNGIELSSGAIRNHRPDIMYKAFEIAGHEASVVDEKFGGMIRAFKFGAPPHGGIAPGVDRIVMLIADEPNIREVILFPMNQRAEDLLMGAPSEVRPDQTEELHIQFDLPDEE